MKVTSLFFFFVGCSFLISGCGPSDRPFTYTYTAEDTVVLTYQGKEYTLVQSEPPVEGLPFTYEFEDDGDLDLTIAGKMYEIDSPYDRDPIKKKTVKKKTSKKTTTKKTTKKSKKKR